ncbi:selenoprotein M-like [Pelobates fuscus]|uniref:selenoprotein M-like n=1 Tax=Pelobates fuscus TaxID=191477 RepID=UPI002FE4AA99
MAQALVFCLLALCLGISAEKDTIETELIEDTEIAKGTVIAPSVVGCYIKSMPELYDFMMNTWALYHNLEYDSREDKEPQVIFYNYKNEELKSVKIKNLKADEISALLDEAGFYRKSQKGEEVPKEFQHYPLKAPRDEL